MGTCETVKKQADNEQGFVIINKSDFDEKKHKMFGEKPAKKAVKKEVKEKPAAKAEAKKATAKPKKTTKKAASKE